MHLLLSFPALGRRWGRAVGVVGLGVLLSACGGGGDASEPAAPTASEVPAASADVAVLMMGNSHTVGGNLPARLQAALAASLPGRQVAVVVAPDSLFLDAHLTAPRTQALLTARRWQAVILQAQKYSSSGLVEYSTVEAEALARQARAAGAVAVMYPEWARRGIDEADRIWRLHAGIASRASACAAPIPQAWTAALAVDGTLLLHASDGNHASEMGAQLTAWTLAATLTGLSPTALPDAVGAGTAAQQRTLRAAAAQALDAQPARQFCPADPWVR